ncbi:hypothetical protein SCUCBS95973_003562 [Sporothrix curviconia]|uniref:UmuC domain-containing protein n=1 Tax=Sporothrix curviconia TaxID=1260050 RepID=A0ABP0BGF9_9PEZI
MADAAHAPPRRRDDRIILHFDYDCFYAQVVQNRAPGGALVGRCVGVTQKSILATCNYEARRRGVRKLMRISEARRICPDIVLVDGEDLSPFRDVSKQLYRLVRDAIGPAAPVERLGLDEVFVDATALVDANFNRILARPAADSRPSLDELFLLSSEGDDEPRGFSYDARACVVDDGPALDLDAKADAVVWQFLDPLPLRSVPGIGFKTSSLLSSYILAAKRATREGETAYSPSTKGESMEDVEPKAESEEGSESNAATVTVGDVRNFPGMSPRVLDDILGGNKDTATSLAGNIPTGRRVWDLLHGVDDTPVRGGRDLPTQISIEDTYAGPRQGTLRPDAAKAVSVELHKLATSLLRRMHVDLTQSAVVGDATAPEIHATDTKAPAAAAKHTSRLAWLARPRTLRLALRPQMPEAVDNRAPDNYFARMTRSQPLPGFVFSLATPPEQIVDRLVAGSLVPMFRKLAASPTWCLSRAVEMI